MPSRTQVRTAGLPKLKTDMFAEVKASPLVSGRLEDQLDAAEIVWDNPGLSMLPPSNTVGNVSILMILWQAKFYIETATGDVERYKKGQSLARIALDHARTTFNEYAAYRAYFYIAESEAVFIRKGHRHYVLAMRCYKKAALAVDKYPYEGNKALQRIAELERMFPCSCLSRKNSPYPWSPVASGLPLTSAHIDTADYWTRAVERRAQRGHYERMASFDSLPDEDDEEDDRYHDNLASAAETPHDGAPYDAQEAILCASTQSVGTSSIRRSSSLRHRIDQSNESPIKSVTFAEDQAPTTSEHPSDRSRKILNRKLTSPAVTKSS